MFYVRCACYVRMHRTQTTSVYEKWRCKQEWHCIFNMFVYFKHFQSKWRSADLIYFLFCFIRSIIYAFCFCLRLSHMNSLQREKINHHQRKRFNQSKNRRRAAGTCPPLRKRIAGNLSLDGYSPLRSRLWLNSAISGELLFHSNVLFAHVLCDYRRRRRFIGVRECLWRVPFSFIYRQLAQTQNLGEICLKLLFVIVVHYICSGCRCVCVCLYRAHKLRVADKVFDWWSLGK